MLINIIILFAGVCLVACYFLFFVRNDWVCNKRIDLLRKSRKDYDMLPSYDKMLFKFWIWDVRKFIKE